MSLKQMVGFAFEVFSFVLSGFLLGINRPLQSIIVLFFAFVFAVLTGNQIKKEAIEESKKM